MASSGNGVVQYYVGVPCILNRFNTFTHMNGASHDDFPVSNAPTTTTAIWLGANSIGKYGEMITHRMQKVWSKWLWLLHLFPKSVGKIRGGDANANNAIAHRVESTLKQMGGGKRQRGTMEIDLDLPNRKPTSTRSHFNLDWIRQRARLSLSSASLTCIDFNLIWLTSCNVALACSQYALQTAYIAVFSLNKKPGHRNIEKPVFGWHNSVHVLHAPFAKRTRKRTNNGAST